MCVCVCVCVCVCACESVSVSVCACICGYRVCVSYLEFQFSVAGGDSQSS